MDRQPSIEEEPAAGDEDEDEDEEECDWSAIEIRFELPNQS